MWCRINLYIFKTFNVVYIYVSMRFLVLFCENQIKHIFRNKLYIFLPSKYFEFRLELSFFLKNFYFISCEVLEFNTSGKPTWSYWVHVIQGIELLYTDCPFNSQCLFSLSFSKIFLFSLLFSRNVFFSMVSWPIT